MVRRALVSDVDHILDIAEVFNDDYGLPKINRERARITLLGFIKHGVVFCSDAGAIVGMTYTDPFRDRTLLLEIGWYADGGGMTGVKLLNTFIKEAKKLEVDAVIMSTLSNSDLRIGKFLERQGFSVSETSYTLELGGHIKCLL